MAFGYGGPTQPTNTGTGMGSQAQPLGGVQMQQPGLATPGGGGTGAPMQGSPAPMPPTPAATPPANPPSMFSGAPFAGDPRAAVANAMAAHPGFGPPPGGGGISSFLANNGAQLAHQFPGFNPQTFQNNFANYRQAMDTWRDGRPTDPSGRQAWFNQRPSFGSFFGQQPPAGGPIAQPLAQPPTGVMPINPNG